MTYISGGAVPLTGTVALVPAGVVQAFAGTSAPTGYLFCDGTAISRTTFASLFSAIGTTWGAGNGSTTFNVPDLRGRAPIGSGTGTGLTARSVGQQTIGEETHALVTAELASHNHTVSDPGHNHTQNAHTHTGTYVFDSAATNGYFISGVNSINAYGNPGSIQVRAAMPNATATNVANTTGITTNNNGSGTGHNNMQPSAVVMFIIKT